MREVETEWGSEGGSNRAGEYETTGWKGERERERERQSGKVREGATERVWERQHVTKRRDGRAFPGRGIKARSQSHPLAR